MNATQKKIQRVQRLRALEQAKLDALTEQLAAIEARLKNQSQQLARLETQISNVGMLWSNDSVEKHSQRIIWTDHLQWRTDELKRAITETESQRNEIRDQVLQQKAKVRGWETFIDRLNDGAMAELQKIESLLADDRYLNDRFSR